MLDELERQPSWVSAGRENRLGLAFIGTALAETRLGGIVF